MNRPSTGSGRTGDIHTFRCPKNTLETPSNSTTCHSCENKPRPPMVGATLVVARPRYRATTTRHSGGGRNPESPVSENTVSSHSIGIKSSPSKRSLVAGTARMRTAGHLRFLAALGMTDCWACSAKVSEGGNPQVPPSAVSVISAVSLSYPQRPPAVSPPESPPPRPRRAGRCSSA